MEIIWLQRLFTQASIKYHVRRTTWLTLQATVTQLFFLSFSIMTEIKLYVLDSKHIPLLGYYEHTIRIS